MSLAPGARLGSYEIVGPLGAGGMGEVYRARDTKLNRDVAIKILPDVFAHDSERVARFTREAQTLASLNHPNIAQIFGVLEEDQPAHVHALVMELVEGEELSTIIARHAGSSATSSSGWSPGASAPGMPLAEALPIARQIADALEAAHEQGIIHRDLKPANVKVRPDGTVKVLDFGLAKALDPAGASGGGEAMHSPTLTARATQLGMIIGTAAYMAPEQARGKAVDRRADIWAFGVVLYEMLTGRRAFDPSRASGSPRATSRGEGDSVVETLAAVLHQDIDFGALPAATPDGVRRLLRRCLEKDPRRRLSSIGDARLELDETESAGAALAAAPSVSDRRVHRRELVAWTATVLSLLAAGAALLWRPAAQTPLPRVVRATLPLPAGVSIELDGERSGMPALSPDGRRVAFGAREGAGPMHVWVLDLSSGVAKPLSGTEGGHRPFWAPDGKNIGFFTWGALSTIPAEGGAVRRLAVARDARGGTWSPNGTILFAPYQRGSLWTVSERGGNAVEVTTTGKELLGTHRFPQFLPDGEHFIYLDRPAPYGPRSGSAVVVGRLGTTPPVARLVEFATNAVYADGHLLYVRDGALVAQPFDPARRELRGEPTALVGDVLYNRRFSYGVFSAGGSGILAFLSGRQSDLSQLVWRDRSGRRLGELGTPGIISGYGGLALSRDGRLAAVARVDDGTSEADIWLYDLERGGESRLVRPGDDGNPVFAADGGQMYFGSTSGNVGILMRRDLKGGSETQLFSETAGSYIVPLASVRDGAAMLYTAPKADGESDLLLRPTAGGGEAKVIVGTPADEVDGQVSPDGRWLAWASDESGRYEVFVAPFPDARGSRFQVSRDGGTQPRWHPKGAELFFKTPDNVLTAAPIEASSSTFSVGTPTALFRIVEFTGWTYAVAPDGERFLVRERLAERDASPITLLTDWGALVKRR
ncbi:MAG TPA: protein kinase [Vicinamibacterales bacterium]|nr:protein kinase [Vicinamibacterales bacterium]